MVTAEQIDIDRPLAAILKSLRKWVVPDFKLGDLLFARSMFGWEWVSAQNSLLIGSPVSSADS